MTNIELLYRMPQRVLLLNTKQTDGRSKTVQRAFVYEKICQAKTCGKKCRDKRAVGKFFSPGICTGIRI